MIASACSHGDLNTWYAVYSVVWPIISYAMGLFIGILIGRRWRP